MLSMHSKERAGKILQPLLLSLQTGRTILCRITAETAQKGAHSSLGMSIAAVYLKRCMKSLVFGACFLR